jgi:polysaccharide biosynthesis transport protein
MRSLPPSSTGRDHSTPDLREATGILRRHRWVLLACPLIGIAIGWGLASTRKPVYEASALIAMGEEPVSVTTGLVQGSQPDAQRIATEIQMLQSRRLAREVVDSLDLQVEVAEPAGIGRSALIERVRVGDRVRSASYRLTRGADGKFEVVDEETDASLGSFAPGEAIPLGGARVVLTEEARGQEEIALAVRPTGSAVEAVESALTVKQPSPDVNMIRVSYRTSDPELARDVPNVLTARYVALRESDQKSNARSTAVFLRAQLDTLSRQLSLSEEELRGYREANRVIDPQLEASTQVTQLAQLRAQRGTIEAERASLAALYNEVRRSGATERPGQPSPYRRLIAFPTLLQNQAATELLSTLADVENQRAALATRRTPEDPDVQVLNSRIAEIERQLQSIVSTYLQGLTNQVAALDAALGRSQAQLDAMPAKETQFQRLSRQPRVLQQTYELLQTRLKEAEIAEAVDDQSVRVIDAADLPTRPGGPGAPIFAIGGAAMALLLGIGLVFAREYADQAVHTRADVQAAIGIPVLGMIPDAKPAMLQRRKMLPRPRNQVLGAGGGAGEGGTRLVTAASNGGAAPALLMPAQRAPTPWSDAYNRLHTNIMFAEPDAEMKTMLFTSPLPGDGKTSTATNYAVTLAQSGLKVLLIDADLRRGSVHELFDSGPTPGLSDLLSDSPVPGVLRHADVGGGKPLRYIAAGKMPPNPVQLLSSTGMRALLECAAQEYDRVIIDTPPLNLFPDAVALSSMVDGVIVVARAGVTPFDALVDTAEQLRHANTRVVGAVLNGIDFERDLTYDTSYRWYQYGKAYAQAASGA